MPTSVLPISWMSPSTVASTTRPMHFTRFAELEQFRLERGDRGFHRFACHHQFRQKGFAFAELIADVIDTDHKAFCDRVQRMHLQFDGFLRELHCLLCFTIDDALRHFLV